MMATTMMMMRDNRRRAVWSQIVTIFAFHPEQQDTGL